MRHQVRRPSASTEGASTSAGAGGAVGATAAGDGGASSSGSGPTTAAAGPSRVGPVTPHSVIRTLRQKSMVNSDEPKRSSFVNSSSTSTLIANLEAAHQREAEHPDNPCVIIRNIVGEMGNVIKEMRTDSALVESPDGVLALMGGTDVDALKQRVLTLERANRMMAIHLDLLELQKKLEAQAEQKLDEKKSFLTATREELFKEIVELLEAEFSCSICNEVFVSPSVTKCGHTFCELCIATWNRDKNDCPICRTVINAEWGKHVEMDNFITRLHIRLSEEIRTSRESLVQERVQQLEQLRNTPPTPRPRMMEFQIPAVVDRIIIRDREGRDASGTSRLASASRAFAERLRTIRRQATDNAQDDPDAPVRLRARVIHEIMRHRYEQQRRNTPSSRQPESQSNTAAPSSATTRLTIPSLMSMSMPSIVLRPRSLQTPQPSTTGSNSLPSMEAGVLPRSPAASTSASASSATENGNAARPTAAPASPRHASSQSLSAVAALTSALRREVERSVGSSSRPQSSANNGASSNNNSSSQTSAPLVPDVDIEMRNPFTPRGVYFERRYRSPNPRQTSATDTHGFTDRSRDREPLSITIPRRPHTRSQDSLGRTLLEMRDNELRSRIRRARASRTRMDRARRDSSSSERERRGARGPTITIRFSRERALGANAGETARRETDNASAPSSSSLPSSASNSTQDLAQSQPSTSTARREERSESPTVIMECDPESPVPSNSTAGLNLDTDESQSPPDVADILGVASPNISYIDISGSQQEPADLNADDGLILIDD